MNEFMIYVPDCFWLVNNRVRVLKYEFKLFILKPDLRCLYKYLTTSKRH